ncbi:MAG: hypothetical protein E6R07_06660 [Nevskiaceae bacterium]|nr:MAG: hypothetical protein E6R07_06660 [Nevskiaceae bacterium]
MFRLRLAGLALAVLLVGACSRSSTPTAQSSGHYDVVLTRTTLGIPHIKANDFGSMGYGYGYAFAEDNLCVLQEDLLTIRGERAKYLGRNGSYTIVPNGVTADNVTSDFFWKFVATDQVVNNLRAKALPELRDATSGFVAGYNRYIRELKAGQHPGRHAGCADAAWLSPITDADMYRRYFRLAIIASSSALIGPIVDAQPPSGLAAKAKAPSKTQIAQALQSSTNPLRNLGSHAAFASNMYAFGKDATANGTPLLWGNPHFPWTGTERLYLAHATIPGKLDIMGASLYGVPAVLIGFTDQFAWSHTVSTAWRFTIYELTLDPTDPTKYLYDGASRAMTAVPVAIDIKESDGSISHATKTLYRSHYGPMLAISASGVPILGWTNAKAYTLRDANAENDRLINQFALWDQAKSLDEFKALHKSVLGVPWVNTVATGPGGKAYYGDVTVVPNVTDAQNQQCASALQPAIQQLDPGLPLLDGSRSACEWGTDADAPAPGIFGPSHLPTLERDDFVHNCNDSYWLTNPAQPLTGYARIIGDENTARTLRTRLCILQAQRRLAGTDGRPGNKMDQATLEDIGLSSQIYSAELAQSGVIASLCALPSVPSSSGPVNTADACAALKNWDGHDNLDSKGGHLWREFWRNVSGGPLPVQLAALNNSYFLTPFSSSDPVNTPNTLNVALPTVQTAFGDAINTVTASGHPFDATLGSLQHPCCIDKSIPIFGGEDFEGAFTVVDGTNKLDADGYRVPYGNSYIQAVTWDANGVVADAFVTYSESTDPANPHFSDYTKEYSAKRWHRLPFHAADVQAQQISQQHLTE